MKVMELITALSNVQEQDMEVIVMHGNQIVFHIVSVEIDLDHNDEQVLITVSKSRPWKKP